MKIVLTFILLITNLIVLSQEHSYLFKRNVILENKVFKIIEYDPTDSVNYFQEMPNGYYSIYDEYGRIIVENYYVISDNPQLQWENITYRLYDSLDNLVGYLDINDNNITPAIHRFYVSSYDNTNNSVKIASLEYKGNSNYALISKDHDIAEPIPPQFKDTTIIDEYHLRCYHWIDSTWYKDIYLNKNKQVDSTIFYRDYYPTMQKHLQEEINVYEYYENGNVKKMTQLYYDTRISRELISRDEYIYFENGLLDEARWLYLSNSRERISKFKYIYYNQ